MHLRHNCDSKMVVVVVMVGGSKDNNNVGKGYWVFRERDIGPSLREDRESDLRKMFTDDIFLEMSL